MEKMGKILVVDDNEDVLFALHLLLESYVEKVKVATSPDKILPFMESFQPDVILLDMNFQRDMSSGQEGFDCLEEILRRDPEAVVVFHDGLFGHREGRARHQGRGHGLHPQALGQGEAVGHAVVGHQTAALAPRGEAAAGAGGDAEFGRRRGALPDWAFRPHAGSGRHHSSLVRNRRQHPDSGRERYGERRGGPHLVLLFPAPHTAFRHHRCGKHSRKPLRERTVRI